MLWQSIHSKKSNVILYLRTDLGARDLSMGGSVTHTLGVINGFVKLGYSIVVGSSAMIPVLKTLNITVLHELKNPRWLAWSGFKINSFLSNIFFTLTLLRKLKSHEIAFVYQRYSMLNCTGLLICFFKKIPLILEFNGSEVWMDNHWSSKWRIRLSWLVGWFEKVNIQHADHIIVVSEPLKEQLLQQGVQASKIIVNPNGVETDIFNPTMLQKDCHKFRVNMGVDKHFVFGFIGTFSVWHGIEILAQMIPQVIQRNKRAHFILIGNGPLRPYLENALEHHNVSLPQI